MALCPSVRSMQACKPIAARSASITPYTAPKHVGRRTVSVRAGMPPEMQEQMAKAMQVH